MERKNTMLLTVIAVATLLVAVVGATFAYFSASAGAGATTTVTVETESASSTTSTSNGNASLYVSAAEMLSSASGTIYTAVATSGATATTDTDDDNGAIEIVIENGSTTQARKCTYTLVYKGTDISSSDSASDITLTVTPSGYDSNDTAIVKTYDELGSETLLATHVYTVAAADDTTHTITYDIALSLENTSVEQDDISGMELNSTVEVGSMTCVFE